MTPRPSSPPAAAEGPGRAAPRPRGPLAVLRGALPAVGLFLLAPLVAEFLLGNLPITALVALVLLAPLYGGGAVLVREVARRAGRGWPTMLTLAVAYGVLEEGVVTMSLFNPDYAGARLLDNGFIPQLGIAGPWTAGVLTLHAVWSIGVPIALVEALACDRGTAPWLGPVGLAVTGALFAVGVVANLRVSVALYQFVAPLPQLVAAGAVAAALVAGALLVGRGRRPAGGAAGGRAPNPWLVGVASFAASGLYKALPDDWSPWLLVGLVLLLDAGAIVAVMSWSRRAGWGGMHRLALAGGALLTYAWSAFPQTPVLPADPTVDLIGNAVFGLGAGALLVVAARRVGRCLADDAPAAEPARAHAPECAAG